jgi:stearoyl-CoA desaturase (Delta-9 desaturase)
MQPSLAADTAPAGTHAAGSSPASYGGLGTRGAPVAKPVTHLIVNVSVTVVPLVGFLVGIVLLWNNLVTPVDLEIMAVMYLIAAIGITMGYHRLLTHRAFETYPALRYLLAVAGSMAGQGSPIIWVADHRKHHAFADEDGDPHSPHVGRSEGFRGAIRGLWHAHLGWLYRTAPASEPMRYASDLVRDAGIRRISRMFLALVGVGMLLPFLAGWMIAGTLRGGLIALVWGGLVRLFVGYHVVFSINSICHFHGRRRFEVDDRSRNVPWLAIPSLGESWHHNHHAFPTSARHGLRWWEIDITGSLIVLMKRLGLAWNVIEVSPEAQLRKLAPDHSTVKRAG